MAPVGVLAGAWRVTSGMAPFSLGSQPRPALMSSWHRALHSSVRSTLTKPGRASHMLPVSVLFLSRALRASNPRNLRVTSLMELNTLRMHNETALGGMLWQ
jgi:hypothetical protein